MIRPTQRTETIVNYNVDLGAIQEGRTDVLSDDLAIIHLQHSTQWDALAHVGSRFDVNGTGSTEMVYYNGYRAGRDIVGTHDVEESGVKHNAEIKETAHAHALGIEHLAQSTVQGPAHLIDLEKYYGQDRQVIGYDKWIHVIEAENIDVRPGDMLLIHTGFAEVIMKQEGTLSPEQVASIGVVLDGTDARLMQWITDSGIIAISADSYAIEDYPAPLTDENTSLLPMHHHCLFRLGVHLGELWRLTPLAHRMRELGRSSLLLTAPPLNLRGAVGSPVSPIATL